MIHGNAASQWTCRARARDTRKANSYQYAVTPKGAAARGKINTTNIHDLVRHGYAQVEGIRYEDFLPVSAAGIFASNLNQSGTKSTAAQKPVYTRATLEEILGRPIVDANVVYSDIEAASLLETFTQLGILSDLPAERRSELACAQFENCPVTGKS